MLTYDEAIARILIHVSSLPAEERALIGARGQILAADIVAPCALPPFDNSQMDGYAVRAGEADRRLAVRGETPAGPGPVAPLEPGTARPIMTGAPLPDGADSVVPLEDAELTPDGLDVREFGAAGQFVRTSGGDVRSGETVLIEGSPVRAFEVGLAAALGLTTLPVIRRPRIAIVSTGDELVEPGTPLGFGQIYNSNGPMLAAQVEEAGGIVLHRRSTGDSPEALRDTLTACADADVILTSGGVSVGGRDHVKAVMEELGTLEFWRVAIRPGKPLAFGTWGTRLFFGLPGNPVSSSLTFELFVRPALRKLLGQSELFRPTVQARLSETAAHEPGRRSYQRAVLTQFEDEWQVRPLSGQGSHQMRTLALANALLVLPDHLPDIPAGSLATVIRLT